MTTGQKAGEMWINAASCGAFDETAYGQHPFSLVDAGLSTELFTVKAGRDQRCQSRLSILWFDLVSAL